MKSLKIKKDETIRFNGVHVTNGHWLFTPGSNTVSDKSLQALIDAGIHFTRCQYDNPVLQTGETENEFDGERVIPPSMGDEFALIPTKFTAELGTYAEPVLCRLFKHRSGRVVAVDERYAVLWQDRACYQKEPLHGLRIENNRSEVVAVVMPVNIADTLPGFVSSLARDMVPDKE